MNPFSIRLPLLLALVALAGCAGASQPGVSPITSCSKVAGTYKVPLSPQEYAACEAGQPPGLAGQGAAAP